MEMKMEIIVLGREILDGTVVDEPSYWMGKDLGEENIVPTRVVIIREEGLKAELESVLSTKTFNVLIIACEFKPLMDDRILNLISEAVKKRLLPNKKILSTLGKDLLESFGKEIPVLPQDADPLKNRKGAALGFKMTTQQCNIYVLPKKIDELRLILRDSIIPELEDKFAL